jgi:DNA-binding winged helix-turn-helix (wHTH) protein/TolB-like protein
VVFWSGELAGLQRMRPTSPAIAVVNGVVVDLENETLRAPDGTARVLRPQSFATLRHLIGNPGRLVSKDELMAAVWRGVAVTDDSLVQCIHDIRRAIGDDAHAIIVNVPRRGYRLNPTAHPERAGGPRPGGRRLLVAGAALLLASAGAVGWVATRPGPVVASIDGPPIVAVTPVLDVAGDAASRALAAGFGRYFFIESDGYATCDNLLAHLTLFREFQAVGRSATFVLQDQPGTLAVDYVLGGTIHRDGDRLRYTALLTEARSGGVVWSERWDRLDRDVPTAQVEISQQLSNRLGGVNGVIQEAARAVAERKRADELTGYELYVLGTEGLASGTRAGAAEAATLLARAAELDPGFARARAELALAHATLAEFGAERARNRALAVEIAAEAVSLDPSDAWTHAAHATALRQAGELVRARSEFDTAVTMARNAAEILTLYAGWAATAGEPERGVAMADRVARLDPGFPPRGAAQFVRAYFMAGRYRAALAMVDRLPTDGLTPAIRAMQAGALVAVGRTEDAAGAVAAALAAVPGLSIEGIVSAPDLGEAERRRLVETMRLAGFPPCAEPQALPDGAPRLPECAARAEARGP